MSDLYEIYEHHGEVVCVRRDLKGKHRDYCLCFSCSKFCPDDIKKNCKIANKNYLFCVKENLVLPVWECPQFVESH